MSYISYIDREVSMMQRFLDDYFHGVYNYYNQPDHKFGVDQHIITGYETTDNSIKIYHDSNARGEDYTFLSVSDFLKFERRYKIYQILNEV